MTSSERKQQSWAAHGYEGEALTRWVEDGLVLEQVLALEKVMAPYRAAQSRIDQILRLLEPLMFVTGVPHVPEHEIRVLSGARPRLKLRFGGARYVFPDRCTPGA